MPRKPLAVTLALAVASLLSVSACSSGSSPGSGSTSSPPSTSPSSSGTKTPASTKLKRESGKGDIKNVIAKLSSGAKVSLAAAAPGHEVISQVYDPAAKTWSPPVSVFKDDTRFCHAIKLKAVGSLVAATVTCSLTAQDKNGTQSSYVLASTDGKSWKRLNLPNATAKPSISPNGKYVAWSSPSSFLLWTPTGTFTTVKYAQSADAPAVAVMQDDGSVVIVKATSGKHGVCVISFQSASAKAPVPHTLNSTLPQDNPKCVITSAKMEGTLIVATFQQTVTTKVGTKKSVKTTTFSHSFHRLPDGHWLIKA